MHAYAEDILKPYIEKIKVLSLDCFDTLLWRKTATPIDVFYDLQNKPSFKTLGITAGQRREAEVIARKIKHAKEGHYEVNLREIYQSGFPSLKENQIAALIEDEIQAEMETCYAFPYILKLLQYAHSQGMKIIIVSSTYFEEPQLRRLLSSALPADCFAAIERIFCSCEFKIAKHLGLFKEIISELSVPAEEILHIGDSEAADLLAPQKVGINALRLIQLDPSFTEIFEMQAIAAKFSSPDIRYTRSLSNPFKGIFCGASITKDKPEQVLGYLSLGPILYALTHFIAEDIQTMRKAGKKPKLIFLMRDAYLISQACEVYGEELAGKRVHLSRFSARAASFRNKEDVTRYINENFHHWDLKTHCKQLLLPPEMMANLIKEIAGTKDLEYAFHQYIQKDEILALIFKNSIEYAKRLKLYLEKEIELKPGDSLVFIDIGYIGTAQNLLTPILLNEMHVKEVTGRYLAAVDVPGWQFTKRGLIDASWCDPRTMTMLLKNFFLIEEMCSSGGDSVIDYDNKGDPIYLKTNDDPEQSNRIKLIQAECIRFQREAKKFFSATKLSLTLQTLRDSALAELVRSVYFMTKTEVNYISNFKHPVNMATPIKAKIFLDPPVAKSFLHRASHITGKYAQSLRQVISLDQMISFITTSRFDFKTQGIDFFVPEQVLKVNITLNGKTQEKPFTATPTHEGYFALAVSLNIQTKSQIEIFFGAPYAWLQLDNVLLIHPSRRSQGEDKINVDLWNQVKFNKMTEQGDKLFYCESEDSSVQIELSDTDETSVFCLTFRPLVYANP